MIMLNYFIFLIREFEVVKISAKEIFKINGINIHLVPVSCKDFESKVNRPKFSALSVSKIENKYKLTIPSWVDSLENNFK